MVSLLVSEAEKQSPPPFCTLSSLCIASMEKDNMTQIYSRSSNSLFTENMPVK